MLIGIDGNEANVKKRVGVGEYAYQVLRHLKKFQISNFKFQIYLKNVPLSDLPPEAEWWRYKVFGPKKLWTQFALPLHLYLDRPRPDVFFTPSHYAPRFCSAPSVISIMDLSFFKFPEMFKKKDLVQLKSWTAYSVKKASRILTISEASKNDIIRYYQVPEEKVVVTYPGTKIDTKIIDTKILRYKDINQDTGILGYKDIKMNVEKIKAKYKIKGDYILYVGTLQPRKNLKRLIEAFKNLKSQTSNLKTTTQNLKLVICGKKGWLYDEIFQKVKDLNLEKSVIFTGFVLGEDLLALYKGARCFVLVSLYEGFGIPVLEALSFGCPVVISDISSLPEIGGKAAIYVDPYDIKDIARGVREVLDLRDAKRQKLIEEGIKQAKKFSWEKCAEETLKVLEEAAKLDAKSQFSNLKAKS